MKTLVLKIMVADDADAQNTSAYIGRLLNNEGKEWFVYQWDSRKSTKAEVEFYEVYK